MTGNISDYLQVYLDLGLTFIPLKPRSKEPLVRWGNSWNPRPADLERWGPRVEINWGTNSSFAKPKIETFFELIVVPPSPLKVDSFLAARRQFPLVSSR